MSDMTNMSSVVVFGIFAPEKKAWESPTVICQSHCLLEIMVINQFMAFVVRVLLQISSL